MGTDRAQNNPRSNLPGTVLATACEEKNGRGSSPKKSEV